MNKPFLVGLAVVASTIAVVSRISSVRRGWIDEVWRFGMDGIDERPDDDHVHYMLAVVHTLRHEVDLALTHLRRAIDLNPDTRTLARQEPDFEPIRRELGFRQAVEPPPTPRRRSRRRTPP